MESEFFFSFLDRMNNYSDILVKHNQFSCVVHTFSGSVHANLFKKTSVQVNVFSIYICAVGHQILLDYFREELY